MSNTKPMIAIAPASRNDDYIQCAIQAGAQPWLLDPAGDLPVDAVRNADGIMLLGGADIEPSRYGEAPHPTFQASENNRDDYETELIALAIEYDVPLLAICRGIQILNVSLGGTLIQDIPSQTSSVVPHAAAKDEARDLKAQIKHEISVTSGTRLHAILGPQLDARGMCAVNSRHHQAVKALGRDLVVTAVAPDGIIEAIERPASSFCVGVQWHPENFCGDEHYNFAALFRAFVSTAERRLVASEVSRG
jgi:putative glutamine amidotransferase